MNRSTSALAILLLIKAAAGPAAAEQGAPAPDTATGESCTGCFAYLEFAPSREPESYATRGDTSASQPAAGDGKGDAKAQTSVATAPKRHLPSSGSLPNERKPAK